MIKQSGVDIRDIEVCPEPSQPCVGIEEDIAKVSQHPLLSLQRVAFILRYIDYLRISHPDCFVSGTNNGSKRCAEVGCFQVPSQ